MPRYIVHADTGTILNTDQCVVVRSGWLSDEKDILTDGSGNQYMEWGV